jgi:hypothetical protein
MFSGAFSHTNPDMIRANAWIRLNGMTEEQREIQQYQDCYHGRLFAPKDDFAASHMKPWGMKWDARGNPVPKSQWKPMYVTSLAKWIVSFHSAKLFSENSFPDIKVTCSSPDIYSNLEPDPEAAEGDPEAARRQAANDKLHALLDALLEQVDIETLMQDASEDGLVQGWVPVLFSIWDSELYYEILDRKWTELTYAKDKPKQIERLVEQYVISVEDKEGKTRYYLKRREVDAQWWREWEVQIAKPENLPVLTRQNMTAEHEHKLGFVPVVKLASPRERSLFSDEVVENIKGLIEYDNNIKHSLTKNLDPQRYMLVDSNGGELELDDVEPLAGEKGDEPLETGTLWPLKAKAVGDFSTAGSHETARQDRQEAVHEILESCHVVRVPDENQQSGKALNLRLEPAKSFISKLRVSMGRKGLAKICRMLIDIAIRLDEMGQTLTLPPEIDLPTLSPGVQLTIGLDWGDIVPPDEDDKGKAIFNAATAKKEKLISKKTAARYTAAYFGVEDIEAELEQISLEDSEAQAQFMQAQNKLFRGAQNVQNDL